VGFSSPAAEGTALATFGGASTDERFEEPGDLVMHRGQRGPFRHLRRHRECWRRRISDCHSYLSTAYRGPTYFAARLVIKTEHLGMPNVPAGRQIIPNSFSIARDPMER
jgi:hypothetical protein